MRDDLDKLAAYQHLFSVLFRTSVAHAALLDLNGVILQTNPAWNRYALSNHVPESYDFVGKNYLKTCEPGSHQDHSSAQQAYMGLLEVLHARRPKFTMTYPCHTAVERQWYRMWVEPQMPAVPAVIVAHYLCATKPLTTAVDSTDGWLGHGSDPTLQAYPALTS